MTNPASRLLSSTFAKDPDAVLEALDSMDETDLRPLALDLLQALRIEHSGSRETRMGLEWKCSAER